MLTWVSEFLGTEVEYLLCKQLTTSQRDGFLHEGVDGKLIGVEEEVADQIAVFTSRSHSGSDGIGLVTLDAWNQVSENARFVCERKGCMCLVLAYCSHDRTDPALGTSEPTCLDRLVYSMRFLFE